MAETRKQALGRFGEELVAKTCRCPSCKRVRTLARLPRNFKCADLICDFCGYLAQVKTKTQPDVSHIPETVLGAAWGPQRERMEAGIYFPVFLILTTKNRSEHAIYYLSDDLQENDMFIARKPLSQDAKRAGWQGFTYVLGPYRSRLVRLD